MTAYLLESSLARFKNVVCCFHTRETNGSPQPLVYFSPMKDSKKFTNVFTRNISELAALKLVIGTLRYGTARL